MNKVTLNDIKNEDVIIKVSSVEDVKFIVDTLYQLDIIDDNEYYENYIKSELEVKDPMFYIAYEDEWYIDEEDEFESAYITKITIDEFKELVNQQAMANLATNHFDDICDIFIKDGKLLRCRDCESCVIGIWYENNITIQISEEWRFLKIKDIIETEEVFSKAKLNIKLILVEQKKRVNFNE